LISSQERGRQILLDNAASCFGRQIAANQVKTFCGIEQQDPNVVWREHTLTTSLSLPFVLRPGVPHLPIIEFGPNDIAFARS
jgi:hypothetical protein